MSILSKLFTVLACQWRVWALVTLTYISGMNIGIASLSTPTDYPIYLPYNANFSSALNLSISSSLKQIAAAISPSGVLGIR